MLDVIIPAYKPALQMLGKNKADATHSRFSLFCHRVETTDAVLFLNTLTCELIYCLPEEEQSDRVSSYLGSHWFIVPDETDEIQIADQVRSVTALLQGKHKGLSAFTIFTTTDCNARCFYCYEKGCRKISMSRETAEDVAAFILRHSGDKAVKLVWIGGEPLYNYEVIDRICELLREAGKEFRSHIISNGYLFSDANVRATFRNWNVRRVQIALDGTEKVYNKVKAYTYLEGNPYQIVKSNIRWLLDEKVIVAVRLNCDRYNVDDLMNLADELYKDFGGEKRFFVYSHLLIGEDLVNRRTEPQRRELFQKQRHLHERLQSYGFYPAPRLKKHLPVNYCMADSGRSVTVLPGGQVGLCDYYTDAEYIGDIRHDDFDQGVLNKWKERCKVEDACLSCVMYPQCIRIRNCPNADQECLPELCEWRVEELEISIKREYEIWKKPASEEVITFKDEDE